MNAFAKLFSSLKKVWLISTFLDNGWDRAHSASKRGEGGGCHEPRDGGWGPAVDQTAPRAPPASEAGRQYPSRPLRGAKGHGGHQGGGDVTQVTSGGGGGGALQMKLPGET